MRSDRRHEKVHRQIAEQFCGLLSSGDLDQLMSIFADDASAQLMLRPELMPLPIKVRHENSDEIRQYFKSAFEVETPHMQMRGLTFEGNRAAIEAVASSPLAGNADKFYENMYHFVLEFRAGKVCAMREYLDTCAAKEAMTYLVEAVPDRMKVMSGTGQ